MKTMLINGVKYAYRVVGAGEPIVLLHGFTGNQQQWDDVVAGLRDAYQVITVDLLGHGATESPDEWVRYSIQNQSNDLMALMDSLGHNRFHLLGYSMGGRLALFMAMTHRERIKSLILESASAGLEMMGSRQKRQLKDNAIADDIEQKGMAWFVGFWEQLPLWDSQQQLSKQVRDKLRQQRLQNNPRGLANSLRGMGTGVQPSLWDDLDRLDMPIQLIVGEQDEKFVALNHEMYDLFPQSDLHIVFDVGHTVHLEQLTEFVKVIQSHLAR